MRFRFVCASLTINQYKGFRGEFEIAAMRFTVLFGGNDFSVVSFANFANILRTFCFHREKSVQIRMRKVCFSPDVFPFFAINGILFSSLLDK
jgi:hypothetical protein